MDYIVTRTGQYSRSGNKEFGIGVRTLVCSTKELYAETDNLHQADEVLLDNQRLLFNQVNSLKESLKVLSQKKPKDLSKEIEELRKMVMKDAAYYKGDLDELTEAEDPATGKRYWIDEDRNVYDGTKKKVGRVNSEGDLLLEKKEDDEIAELRRMNTRLLLNQQEMVKEMRQMKAEILELRRAQALPQAYPEAVAVEVMRPQIIAFGSKF